MKQQDKIKNLIELIASNPDLEIMPMVETEVVGGDDFHSWLGDWGKAQIDEYYSDEESIWFKSESFGSLVDDRVDNGIWDEYMNDDEIYDAAVKIVEAYEWTKCILVRITTL